MRELVSHEIQHVTGGNFFGDLQTMGSEGMTGPEKSTLAVGAALGLSIGSFLPFKLLGPLCGLGLLIGWYVYDMQTTPAATS